MTEDAMIQDALTATTTVEAAADAVFAVLADPTRHAAIDGTGWVRESLDGRALAEVGQIFRIAMYHGNRPNGEYEIENRIIAFDRPHVIAWEPGYRPSPEAAREFGGWTWRYDLAPVGPSRTRVTLTYDWSSVSPAVRERIGFPPFGPEHLQNSLRHLAELAERG